MSNHLKFYINGAWVDPATPATLDVINPATEEAFTKISIGSAADVDKAVAAAKAAFPTFSQTTQGRARRAAEAHHRELQDALRRHRPGGLRRDGRTDRHGARRARPRPACAHLESTHRRRWRTSSSRSSAATPASCARASASSASSRRGTGRSTRSPARSPRPSPPAAPWC